MKTKMKTKMKTITSETVLLVATTLVSANGSTTTLEVKEALRLANYKANQKEVSAEMKKLTNNFSWLVRTSLDGTHQIYERSMLFGYTNVVAPIVINTKMLNRGNSPTILTLTKVAKHLAKKPFPKASTGNWEVNSTVPGSPTCYYSHIETRDKVRQMYSKANGVPFASTRSRKSK